MTNNRLENALQGRRIADFPGEELLRAASNLLRQAYALTGYKAADPKDLAILTAKLAADLAENYKYLTFEEVSYCFEMGAKGEYGDFAGIHLRTFSKWLKGYKTSDTRYRAKLAQENGRKALPPISEAYEQEAEDRFLANSFRRYKETGSMERVFSARVYQVLQRRGVIRHSVEEKRQAVRRFEQWRPANRLPVSERMRLIHIYALAQEWLLKQYFDSVEELRLGNGE